MKKTLIDISMPLHPGMPVWKDERPPRYHSERSIAAGDGCNVSSLSLGLHCGTHVDAPSHFLAEGATVDQLDLSLLVGPARVIEVVAPVITAQVLEPFAGEVGERLLIKTPHAACWRKGSFEEDFAALDLSGAEWLVKRGVRLIGLDYLSVERFALSLQGNPVHHLLLGAGLVLLEGLRLEHVLPGTYELMALPLNCAGREAAPVRAVLAALEERE